MPAITRVTIYILLHTALLTFGLAIWGLFFNLAILAAGFPREFLGLLNTISTAAAVVCSLPLWSLVTRIGLRPALIMHAILQAGGALGLALADDRTTLLVLVALIGAASVLFQVAAQPLMMRYSTAASRNWLFSASAAIMIGAAGLGSLVGGYLPTLLANWLGVAAESAVAYRATFGVAAVLLLLALVPLLLGGWGPPPADAAPPARAAQTNTPSIIGLLRRWRVWQVLLPPAITSLGAALLIPYLNLFFKERFAVADTTLGWLFAAFGAATGLAILAGPPLAARFGRLPAIIGTQLASLPLLLAAGLLPWLWPVALALLGRAALYNLGTPLYEAFALEQIEADAQPILSGMLNGAATVGYIVVPGLSVWVQAHYGFTPLFLATGVLYMLSALLAWGFFMRRPNVTGYGLRVEG